MKTPSGLASAYPENAVAAEMVIDWAMLADHFDGNQGLIEQLIELTLRTQAEIPIQLAQAANQADWEGMARLAHDLKSLSGHFQVGALVELAKNTERAARDRQPDAPQLAQSLAAGAEQMMSLLRAQRVITVQTNDPSVVTDFAGELRAFARALRGQQMEAYHLAERLQTHLPDDDLRPVLEMAIRAALGLEFAVALSHLEPALAAIEAGEN